MKKRLGIILLFTSLFAGFIINWGYSYKKGLEEAYIPISDDFSAPIIPLEKGVFERSEYALAYLNMPIDKAHQRTLATYYNNRAYPGAPPSIPHPLVKGERGMGGKTCLQCHQNGGFAEQFQAYAPVTPHPEMINCRQCHVAQKESTVFKETTFFKTLAASVGNNNALPGSPPIIPHQIQMRENCLSCHAGPAAPKEIRVTHPDRINCRQCHVPEQEMISTAVFTRKIFTNDQ
ncbi:multiheme c-type cytochrome [uncultured Aquimarina sp.]|uniref:multiheme c-type cytochrome n=1 Tax=uncultured Aquimarina sp. TaxID=575652 RepID=UPI00262BA883|nr:multiheme c-type cytochrome [uncultured Aquimarina sp.]